MSTNKVQKGDTLDNVTAGAVTNGAVVKALNTVGVALKGAAGSGEVIPLAVEGVFTVPKVTGRAWVQGEKLFWDVSTSSFDTMAGTTATGDVTGCAIAAAAAASGDATGQVKLTPGNTAIT
jgi:predicted RecA/RadA family phage recombinase